MRALTVHQPWAWAILHAGKDVENRSVLWRYTGTLLSHAGKMWDPAAGAYTEIRNAVMLDYGSTAPLEDPQSWGMVWRPGHIVGVVQLLGSHRASVGCCPDNPWARRPLTAFDHVTHLRVRNPRPLPVPIPTPGKQGLWSPDPATVAAVTGQIGDVA